VPYPFTQAPRRQPSPHRAPGPDNRKSR